jgi:hypothetical protein
MNIDVLLKAAEYVEKQSNVSGPTQETLLTSQYAYDACSASPLSSSSSSSSSLNFSYQSNEISPTTDKSKTKDTRSKTVSSSENANERSSTEGKKNFSLFPQEKHK